MQRRGVTSALWRRAIGRTVAAFVAAAAVVLSPIAAGVGSAEPADADIAPNPEADVRVYPETEDARDFNAGAAGWTSKQEYSAGCWVRGGTCTKIDGEYIADGGQDGAGDGFLRFNGNSAAAYPFPWGQGAYAQWNSPKFTYDSPDAQSWTFTFDWRSSKANYALGWNGITVEIRNAEDKVVRTAVPAQIGVPTNAWRTFEVPFDGSRETFHPGEEYYISIVAIDYYGPSAASLGYHDIDNVSMTTSTEPGAEPWVKCEAAPDIGSGLIQSVQEVLTLKPQSLCPLTEPTLDATLPVLDIADEIVNDPGISKLLDTGNGAFMVIDNATGQATAWFAGRDHTIPSVDPRKLYVWADSGQLGHAAGYALVFVTYQPEQVINAIVGHPDGVPGAVLGAVEGQLGAAGDVLSDPVGEALDIDVDWSVDNVMWHVGTVLNGAGLPIDVPALPTGSLPLPVTPGR